MGRLNITRLGEYRDSELRERLGSLLADLRREQIAHENTRRELAASKGLNADLRKALLELVQAAEPFRRILSPAQAALNRKRIAALCADAVRLAKAPGRIHVVASGKRNDHGK